MMRVAAVAVEGREIRCKREGCDQMIAREGARGDVYPVVVGAFVDDRGRMVVVCPRCGERNRLPTRRAA